MDSNSLLLFFNQKQPRRIRVIENILTGRKTVSTLFWGMRYGILDQLGMFKSLDLNEDHDSLKQLLGLNLLKPTFKNQYLLTQTGLLEQNKIRANYYAPKSLNANFQYNVKRFRARFLLIVQIISEFSFHNVKYYPLQIDFKDAMMVKRWFHTYKHHQLIPKIKHLIESLLNQLPTQVAWQMASTFVGHDEAGQTYLQQSLALKKSVFEIKMMNFDLFCAMIHLIIKDNDPMMMGILNGLKRNLASDSAIKTFQLSEQESLDMVEKKRHIKMSTVQEHILEVAICTPKHKFPFHHFLNHQMMNRLASTYSGAIDDWDYRSLNGHSIDFFYFRLYQIFRSKL
ncbi:hypothetical protein WR164_08720 [Philodulcilactobacillus myokoensis]|uniref:Helicase Helix-turn-helix domain-containing protein n=1 Tax=Philodulcilactobacillus myokoensis TaxID=2929573 RepID=A0A9W6B1F2_9LACO|nr:hypothetical protein [Philodulcilactobacillus myokoensis]GLB46893.1 hypothetical protein WR164_08720 [Philodulcilactobacillus myokoensis]